MAVKGTFMQMFAGHTDAVSVGRFAPDGKSLCTGGEDATLRVWNPKTGTAMHTVSGHAFHQDAITALALHGTRQLCATGGLDSLTCLTQRDSGRIVAQLAGHEASVECVAWAVSKPTSDVPPYAVNYLATSSLDETARVWDCDSGNAVRVLRGHSDAVVRVAFASELKSSPGALLLTTASTDGTARLWDVRQDTPLYVWHGHLDAILDAQLSRSNETLVCGGDDRRCLSFHLPTAVRAAAATE